MGLDGSDGTALILGGGGRGEDNCVDLNLSDGYAWKL